MALRLYFPGNSLVQFWLLGKLCEGKCLVLSKLPGLQFFVQKGSWEMYRWRAVLFLLFWQELQWVSHHKCIFAYIQWDWIAFPETVWALKCKQLCPTCLCVDQGLNSPAMLPDPWTLLLDFELCRMSFGCCSHHSASIHPGLKKPYWAGRRPMSQQMDGL